jgi:hypothetical protein
MQRSSQSNVHTCYRYLLHLGYAGWSKAMGPGMMCRVWLVQSTNGSAVASGALQCDDLGSLSFISFQIGETIHDSHVLVARIRDEETAKSCGPCARALWLNVLGFLKLRRLQDQETGQAKIHIPATWIFELSWECTHGLYSTVDELSRLLWRRPRRTDNWTQLTQNSYL